LDKHSRESSPGHSQYVAQNSEIYADRLIDRLTRRSEQIGLFPQSSRIVPEYKEEHIREVIERPYRIVYRVKKEQVDLLAVLHCARQMSDKTLE
jgi:plasmid stabilization system protein ParE